MKKSFMTAISVLVLSLFVLNSGMVFADSQNPTEEEKAEQAAKKEKLKENERKRKISECLAGLDFYWGDFEEAAYTYVKNNDEESMQILMEAYADIMEAENKVSKVGNIIPPGICADYGYQLIVMGKKTEGINLLKKEIQLYPQSKTFCQRVINAAN